MKFSIIHFTSTICAVTHIFRSLESAKEEIPNVLKSKDESRPLAVVLGGAFDEQAFFQIRDSVLKSGEKTTWLRKDENQKATISPSESQSGYGEEIGQRVKEALLKLASDQSLFHPSNEVKVY